MPLENLVIGLQTLGVQQHTVLCYYIAVVLLNCENGMVIKVPEPSARGIITISHAKRPHRASQAHCKHRMVSYGPVDANDEE